MADIIHAIDVEKSHQSNITDIYGDAAPAMNKYTKRAQAMLQDPWIQKWAGKPVLDKLFKAAMPVHGSSQGLTAPEPQTASGTPRPFPE